MELIKNGIVFNTRKKSASTHYVFQFLTRGESIFRQEWELDEDKIRSGLKITSHPALLPYVARFLTDTGHNVSLHYEVNKPLMLRKIESKLHKVLFYFSGFGFIQRLLEFS